MLSSPYLISVCRIHLHCSCVFPIFWTPQDEIFSPSLSNKTGLMQVSGQETCKTDSSLRWVFFCPDILHPNGQYTQSVKEHCHTLILIRGHSNFFQIPFFNRACMKHIAIFHQTKNINLKPKPHTEYFPSLFMYLLLYRKAWDLELDFFHSLPLKAYLAQFAHVHKR